ncbi:MAG TPA: hypothetical protein DCM86_02910 [Verrucomicrobiales bacterium]|nr:hypothetical protein [Verrucomicrobiales bacterium]
MSQPPFHILTRRAFLDSSFKAGLGVALSTLLDVPPIIQRSLAEGTIGINGKKVIFIFLRGANDALNSCIPVGDPAYFDMGTIASPQPTRPDIGIDLEPGVDYSAKGPCFDPTAGADSVTARATGDPVYLYDKAIRLGNGFAGLHPALKFLAPVYNAGHLALVHRVAYPLQSRSHFDSQAFWESGAPYSNSVRDGLFYRAMIESGLANTSPFTGVSVQQTLPLILRGSAAAMTNITSTDRFSLLGLPSLTGRNKSADYLRQINGLATSPKKERELLQLQFENLSKTLDVFDTLRPNFSDSGNTFRDNIATDGDTDWYQANGNQGYYLFPTRPELNGGWVRAGSTRDAGKFVVPNDSTSTDFFNNLKAAAILLNKTDAIVAGTQLDGFDTHSGQGAADGYQASLLRRVGWAIYALRKYFMQYADRATWENVVIVTLTEFGRTTVQNSNGGTDHAEAGVMWVAGGGIKGFNGLGRSGVFGCSTADPVPWVPGPPNQAGGVNGSMFGVENRYLKRAYDYRSVLGEVIRKHLGATQSQLNRIIPGYAVAGEHLLGGGVSSIDGTRIIGEPGIL